MSHTPFILAAYSFATVLLAWCALAPLFLGRRLRSDIASRIEIMEKDNASDA
jgi:hypothetical protein